MLLEKPGIAISDGRDSIFESLKALAFDHVRAGALFYFNMPISNPSEKTLSFQLFQLMQRFRELPLGLDYQAGQQRDLMLGVPRL